MSVVVGFYRWHDGGHNVVGGVSERRDNVFERTN